ncbi:MAG: hypothetical protein Q8K26_05400, partial [Candidatus Gracilibacteria bacterium]|nr:hypothetical protein [Candidatus Gracilibacteria bacterium]
MTRSGEQGLRKEVPIRQTHPSLRFPHWRIFSALAGAAGIVLVMTATHSPGNGNMASLGPRQCIITLLAPSTKITPPSSGSFSP